MARRGTLVAISGVDCAGKSTQIERLRTRAVSDGLRVHVMWYRPGYSRRLDAVRALVRRTRPSLMPKPGSSPRRETAFQRRDVRTAWIATALVDSFIEYGVVLRKLLRSNDLVICDRYLRDAELDLALRFPALATRLSTAFRAVQATAPKPDVQILLMISRAEMERRAAEKNEPFPDPPELRAQRFARYEALAASHRMTVVEAERPVGEIHAEVWRTVERHLSIGT